MISQLHVRVAGAVAIAGAAAAMTAAAAPAAPAMQMQMMPQPLRSSGTPALRARFDFLSRQTSNNCGLQPAGVMKMRAAKRLQGSCCAPMAYAEYVKQINGLTAYRRVSEIPRDPYDISVALAQRLLRLDRSVALTPAEQAVYRQATKLAEEGGPCCCRCWRYAAFRGQAKDLIARRRYSAAQIAKIWDLEDGCGGNGKSGGMMG